MNRLQVTCDSIKKSNEHVTGGSEENRKRQARYFYDLCSHLKSITNVSLYATHSTARKIRNTEIEIKQVVVCRLFSKNFTTTL